MHEAIRERQNCKRSLDRLAAQRLLYRRVKTVENWRLVFVFLVAVMLLIGLAVEAEPFSQGATVAVVLFWFFDQVVLVRCAGQLKEEAAAIQEDFDCFVLDMPWPSHLGVVRPTDDRMKELTRQAGSAGIAGKELSDWYCPENIPEEAIAAQLHCQRMNCRWDGRLRKEWIFLVSSLVGVSLAAGVVAGAAVGVTLLEVVLGVAAGIRLLAWLLLEQRAQFVAQKRMNDLHRYLSRAEAKKGDMAACEVRLVQAAIFEHRRTCPTVPEWFFQVRRNAHQEEHS